MLTEKKVTQSNFIHIPFRICTRIGYIVLGNVAKSKWKNLKDQFRRENQKIPVLKSGSKAIPTKSKWQYFESLQFLTDYTSPAPTQGNLNDTRRSTISETQSDSEIYYDEIDHSTSNDENDADVTMNTSLQVTTPSEYAESASRRRQSEASTSRSHSQLSSSRPSSSASVGSEVLQRRIPQKRNSQNLNQQYLELQKKKVTLLEKEVNRGDEQESADLQFFRSLLPYMERLSLVDKLELRSTIQQLVFDKFKETMIQPVSVQQTKQPTQRQPRVPAQPKKQPVTQRQPPEQQNQEFLQSQSPLLDETPTYHELLPIQTQPTPQPLPQPAYGNNYLAMGMEQDEYSESVTFMT